MDVLDDFHGFSWIFTGHTWGKMARLDQFPGLLESLFRKVSSPGVEDPWPETSHLFHAAAVPHIWMMVFLLIFLGDRCLYLDVPTEWPFQEKLEVPTIYKAYCLGEYMGISP